MKRKELAQRLIKARTVTERRKLLRDHSEFADELLAADIRALCYAAWSTNPVSARKAASAIAELNAAVRSPVIAAERQWVEGVAAITQGELDLAAERLTKASAAYSRLGEEHLAAQPLVAKMLALGMLGQYAAASRAGVRALRIFERHDDKLAAGKVELNLSNIASRRERHREAERYGVAAVARFAGIGERTWQTMAENSLANTYAELNDLSRAEDFYLRALERARADGMNVTEAEIEASLGNLETARGRYGEALRLFERSRRRYEKLGMPHQTAIAELEIADIYLELNLAKEAIEIYRRTAPALGRLRLKSEEGRARANYGRAAAKLGKYAAAKRQLASAARIYEEEANGPAAAMALLEVARIALVSGGDPRGLAARARRKLRRNESPRRLLAADWMEAEIRRNEGRRSAAEAYKRVAARAAELEQAGYLQAALTSLGKIALEHGDRISARDYFEQASEIVEIMRAPLPDEEFKIAFMSDRLEPFRELTRIALADNDVEKAFIWNERTRARSLAENMTADAPDMSDPVRAALDKRREELNRIYVRMDTAAADVAAKLGRAAIALERRIAALSRKIGGLTKGLSARSFSTGDLALVRARLGNDRVLVEFSENGENLSAFVIVDGEIRHFADLASNSAVRAAVNGLQFQFETLRYGNKAVASLSGALKKRADHYLTELYRLLFAPIADLVGSRDVIVVPAGAAYYVPFHALLGPGGYVAQERETVYAPSASVWLGLPRSQTSTLDNALVVGRADDKIPHVEAEVAAVRSLFPDAKVLTGEQATFGAYIAEAPGRHLIHFACHGRFRADDPVFSGLHLADGWVTVADIARQRLSARLVTLSACESGVSGVAAGDEAIGLARGFLSAGAASIVTTLWTISDEAAARIMQAFYSTLKSGERPARALRMAQSAMASRGDHPYYWAPFILVGR